MKTFKLLTLLSFIFLLSACSKDDDPGGGVDPGGQEVNDFSTGWFASDDQSKVPVSTNFGFGNGTVPNQFDIVDKFPPIGNQGQYGTCVSWAVAYNTKTALSGIQNNLSGSDLASTQNQFSPKDMFTAIPDQEKGPNCNGTNFQFALDLLQNRGVATMSSVPYDNLGSCAQNSVDPSWTTEAANYKIKYWRKIEATALSIKQNVANNIPVILGAKLADNFMNWSSDDVISSHSFFDASNKHGYHAMVIAGYDDAKGPNGAFRVINSWGEQWGDRGYIWIDYNFLLTEFGIDSNGDNSLFIAANQDGEVAPPNNDDDPAPSAQGVDMAPWIFSDYNNEYYSGIPTERQVEFNLYNVGTKDAKPTSNWNIYYIYFNAYDANDYGVMFYDEFNTSIEAETWECPTANNCIVNTTIPAQGDFATQAFGTTSILRTYNVPNITGEYYLVMIADATDVFVEQDEQNNLFYTSLDPLYFENGYAFRAQDDTSTEFKLNGSATNRSTAMATKLNQSAQNGKFANAYTGTEIMDLIQQEKKSGKLAEILAQFNSVKEASIYTKVK